MVILTQAQIKEKISTFTDDLTRRNMSPGTIQNYQGILLRVFSGGLPDDGAELVYVFNGLYDGLAPGTRNLAAAAVTSFYRWLVKTGTIEKDVSGQIERARSKDTRREPLPQTRILESLQNITDPRDRLIIRVLFSSGIRVSELCSLQIPDLDGDTLLIQSGKGGKTRRVYLDDDTAAELRLFIGTRTTGPVFRNMRTLQALTPRTVQRIIRARLDGSPHQIRHATAQALYNGSHDLQTVQKILGHSSIAVTDRYLHPDDEKTREQYRKSHPLSCREPEQ